LVVTGTAGVGKSTPCARLAGAVRGAVCLDVDIFANEMVSVAAPNQDYDAFWRSMMRLAHELAQNGVVVVYFSTMLPEQVLANVDDLAYFDSVHFFCLTCPEQTLRARLLRRDGADPTSGRFQVWVDFDAALTAAARETKTALTVDASRAVDDLEQDVRGWVETHVRRFNPLIPYGRDSSPS
jgi:predicted kinase